MNVPKRKQTYFLIKFNNKKHKKTWEPSYCKVRLLRLDFYEKNQFISAAHLLFDITFYSRSLLTPMEIYPLIPVYFGLSPL